MQFLPGLRKPIRFHTFLCVIFMAVILSELILSLLVFLPCKQILDFFRFYKFILLRFLNLIYLVMIDSCVEKLHKWACLFYLLCEKKYLPYLLYVTESNKIKESLLKREEFSVNFSRLSNYRYVPHFQAQAAVPTQYELEELSYLKNYRFLGIQVSLRCFSFR